MPLSFSFLSSRVLPCAILLGSVSLSVAQQPAPPPANSPLMQRMSAFLEVPNGAWTPQQITSMNRLRDAALTDPYAMNELRHLTDNIGPRLSGSPQAQQAVDYVAAEMRSLGAEVTLEKTSVPHWVRGAETAQLVAWPGMAPGHHPKDRPHRARRQRRHACRRTHRRSHRRQLLQRPQSAQPRCGKGQDPALQREVRQAPRRPGPRF